MWCYKGYTVGLNASLAARLICSWLVFTSQKYHEFASKKHRPTKCKAFKLDVTSSIHKLSFSMARALN